MRQRSPTPLNYVRTKRRLRLAIRPTNLMTCYRRVRLDAELQYRTVYQFACGTKPQSFPVPLPAVAFFLEHFQRSNAWSDIAGWLKWRVFAHRRTFWVCIWWEQKCMGPSPNTYRIFHRRSCGVVGSTLAFGSTGHGFESENRLFSYHIAWAFRNLRSLSKCSLDSVRRLI